MSDTTRNPRNAGRKSLGRVATRLDLDPPVKQALTEWAATHSVSANTAANILLAEALHLSKSADADFESTEN
jgi:hypothetical protein